MTRIVDKKRIMQALTELGLGDEENGADVQYMSALQDVAKTIKELEQTDVLDKIRAEIEQMPSELTADGRRMIRRGSVFRIIDKYRKEQK